LIAVSASALAACGSHDDPAPLVYGTQPASTGRIYNSQADYYRYNQPAQQAYAAPTYQPVYSAPSYAPTRPAPLTPVTSTVYQSELPPVSTYIAAAEPMGDADGDWITVQPGDTVYAIARRTGSTPQAIIAENHLRPPYGVNVGETLRIPDRQQKIANDFSAPAPPPMMKVVARDRMHTVRSGDTLYSISRSSGASVQAIAQANRLRPPYRLQVGEQILIPGAREEVIGGKVQREARAEDVGEIARNISYTQPTAKPERFFEWPVKGAIIGEYGAGVMGRRNDGVNIAAPVGTPVRSAADGEVVYRGSELDGYGNLILIKHSDNFVTAYAHNDVMLVRKGDIVRQGQVIAKVGKTGAATEPQLHFEIRQNLKSVDPLAFLNE
jgi:murein DD-endopeptidase MepM/ murein hydrolase activator NlpD